MRNVYTGKEMQEIDRYMIEEIGIPSASLMERAGSSLFEEILRVVPSPKRVGVLAGSGNNGGDGVLAARLFALRGVETRVYYLSNPMNLKNEAKRQYLIAEKCHVTFTNEIEDLKDCDVLIDGAFGTGLSRMVEGDAAAIIEKFNEFSGLRFGVDIPSGISSLDGHVMGTAVRCDYTVTFAYEKTGLLLYPGREYAGEIILRDVGIQKLDSVEKTGCRVLEDIDISAMLPRRFAGSNKGSYGHVLVVAGSYQMAGAAYFSAKAAYLCGAGLVKVLTDERNREIIQNKLPEALIDTYGSKLIEDNLKADLEWADVVLMGPGLGVGTLSEKIFDYIFDNVQVPLILDADGLNILSKNPMRLLKPHMGIVVTPHIAEMARLRKVSNSYVLEHMIPLAEEFSRDYQATVVLKNATCVTSVPYGNTYLNLTGNNGMSVGGSGDVLSGMIAGFMAQHVNSEVAAPLSVYLHGKAGDLAVRDTSVYSLRPDDILDYIPKVLL